MKIGPTTLNPISKKTIASTSLDRIAKEHPVIDTFLKLAVIPSPSIIPGHTQEKEMQTNLEKVRSLYASFFEELGINKDNILVDEAGSLIIFIPGSKGFEDKKPLMLMGHIDIVPGNKDEPLRPINPTLIKYKHEGTLSDWIASDGTTTLGADDKAGLAIIWDVVRKLKKENIPHVPLEIVVSPDEETTCESIGKLASSKLKSKYVVIVDENIEFHIVTGGAGFTDLSIKVKGLKGGHSGEDIHKKDIVSAANILLEILQVLGNGVVEYNPDFSDKPLISKNIYECSFGNTPANAIPREALIKISMRSQSKKAEDAELKRIKKEIKKIEAKYKEKEKNLSIAISVESSDPPWNGNSDSKIALIADKAARNIGHKAIREPAHAFYQANLVSMKKNFYGEKLELIAFGPLHLGLHSTEEKVNIESILETSDWLLEVIKEFSK